MSREATNWVSRCSPTNVFPRRQRASRQAVLLDLARYADKLGQGAFRSHAQLVEVTELGERTVKRALVDLEKAQLIVRHRGGRDHCPSCARAIRGIVVYDLALPAPVEEINPDQMTLVAEASTDTPDRGHMAPVSDRGHESGLCHGGPGSGVTVAPTKEERKGSLSLGKAGEVSERLGEHPALDAAESQRPAREHERTSVGARGAAPKPVTHRGRTVPKPVVAVAERLLDVFNEAAGTRLGARTGDGRPSPALKQIAGALLERPGEPAETWERGVRAMLADPPSWIEDRIMVGHLFGPRAAEHTLARGSEQPGAAGAVRRGGGLSGPDWRAIATELEAREAAAA